MSLPPGQSNLIDAVQFFKQHVYADVLSGLNILPDDIGANRQLPLTPIDQDSDENSLRLAALRDRVKRGANRSPTKNNIIDQHNSLAVHRNWIVEGSQFRRSLTSRAIVPIRGDIHSADCWQYADVLLDFPRNAPGQIYAAGTNADQDQSAGITALIDDLMAQAHKSPPQHVVFKQDLFFLRHDEKKPPDSERFYSYADKRNAMFFIEPFPASPDRIKRRSCCPVWQRTVVRTVR
jgi:hypothetical protein